MANELSSQLARVFAHGVVGNPSLAGALHDTLPAHDGATTYTKAEANYRQADGEQKCGNCSHYAKSKCDIVSGNISPNFTCDHYEAKAEPDAGKASEV